MTEKQYNLRAGYYHNYTGICSGTDENLTTNEVVDLLNEQETKLKRIEKEVDCNVYHDDLKDIVLEIRCILNGDVE